MKAKFWTELPTEAGRYEVKWNRWTSAFPVYMEFDGKQWVNLDELRLSHKFQVALESNEELLGEFWWYPHSDEYK